MNQSKTIVVATLIAGISLVVPAHIALFETGAPTVLSPLPALIVIPAFAALPSFLVVLIPSALFFIWSPGLFRGSARVPRRTHILFGGIVALSVVWFLMGWRYGVQYQGLRHTFWVGALNLLWIIGIGTLFLIVRKTRPTFAINLVVHLLLFAWLSWYAFPYLGELP